MATQGDHLLARRQASTEDHLVTLVAQDLNRHRLHLSLGGLVNPHMRLALQLNQRRGGDDQIAGSRLGLVLPNPGGLAQSPIGVGGQVDAHQKTARLRVGAGSHLAHPG